MKYLSNKYAVLYTAILISFLLVHIPFCNNLYSQSQEFSWAERAGGESDEHVTAITTDKMDNIIIVGSFRGTATFGTTMLISAGEKDIFIAKYDKFSNFIWAKKAGGINFDEGKAVTTDSNNNIIITGYFNVKALFEEVELTSEGSYDIFIAKYDSMGKLQWLKQIGGPGGDAGNGIATDKLDNIYITGEYHIADMYGEDIFVTKYDKYGNVIWMKQHNDVGSDRGNDITIDELGDCIITGRFVDTVTFDTITLTSGTNAFFIAKYDKLGNVLWAKHNEVSGYSEAISTDSKGNIFITGNFEGRASFENISLTSVGGKDIFVSKYDSLLSPQNSVGFITTKQHQHLNRIIH